MSNTCHHCKCRTKTYHYTLDGKKFCSATCSAKHLDEKENAQLLLPLFDDVEEDTVEWQRILNARSRGDPCTT